MSANHIKDPHDNAYHTDLAYIDDLTNLYNRRYLKATLPKEISKMKAKNRKLSLFMMDCDSFKSVNDTYGHINGDRVLVEIAGVLTKEIGIAGILVRYAGDEFTAVLPERDLKASLEIAHRLLKLAKEHKIELKDGKIISDVTLSIGIATYPNDADSAEELIDKADQALYSAKRTGKNKVSTVNDLVIEVRDRDLLLKALPCKKFIDREKEIEFLKKSYENAKKGARKFILIEGKQGIGKTRLMLELFTKHPRFLLKCRKENLGQQYGAISDALNGFLDFMDAGEVLRILTILSDIHKLALVSTVDKIRNLPIRYSGDKPPSIEELGVQEIFLAFINFIKELKPGIIPVIVDDISWIDRGSLEIIRWILEGAANAGAFVIGTLSKNMLKTQIAQKAPLVDFLGSESIREILETINLEPLTEDDISMLLKAVFLDLSVPTDVERKIFQMSWGFPANIEEIIKYMLENKIIYPKEGKWLLDDKRLDIMPVSLKDLLNKRISGLDDESRDVLSKAAILGNDFNIDVLKSFWGKNEGQLLDILDKLSDRGMFQQSVLTGEAALSFVNNIIKDSIYNAIEKKKLQLLHRKVAEILEDYHGFEISRVYGKLKHHLEEAGETDKLKSFTAKYNLPSYIKSVIAEEAEPSVEEFIETPLSKKSEKMTSEVVTCLRSAWINSQLYPPNNIIRMDSMENLNSCIKRVLENDTVLTVTVSGENIILNNQLVDRRKINIMLARSLASLFFEYGIESITFKRGLHKNELEKLFSFLGEKADYIEEKRGFTKLLKENNITNIKIYDVGFAYKRESDLTIRTKKIAELFKKLMPTSQAIGNLFSVDDEGLAINKDVFTDSKKTFDSISNAIIAISEQKVSEENKSFMILEGLYKTIDELTKRNITGWEEGKKRLGELFLSMEPHLRTEIIRKSNYYEKDISNFISDILSELDKKDIIKILNEGRRKTEMPPEELNDFLKVILRSQYLKNMTYDESLNLFKEVGVEKEIAKKALDDGFTEFFFNKTAKELIESEKSGSWERKSIDNLAPLTEALIIKGDTKTIEELAKSLFAKMKSPSPSLRSSAIEGIGKILETLLEKEVLDISAAVGNDLSECLKTEENINVYVGLLKDLETMINNLIQKQGIALLITPLIAIKEEIDKRKRPVEFRSYAEGTINRILSSKNVELLLFSFRKKAEKDYLALIDLMAQFGEKISSVLLELLCMKDDARIDPFDIYMKKRHIALIMKKIGDKAILKLKDLLNDRRSFVVKNIIDVFDCINDKKYIPYLEQATKNPDKEVQKEALNVIKKLEGEH